MKRHEFGSLPEVSTLTLGGGGLGMLWGQTTFEECVATVHAAVDAGINCWISRRAMATARRRQVVGEAFGGRLPAGVHVTSKCNLGNPAPDRVERILRQSIETSLRLLQRDRLDMFFLHSNLVPDGHAMWNAPDVSRLTPLPLFRSHVRPAFEKLQAEGLIGAWGLTGIGHPDAIIEVLAEDPKPAAVQCIANLLDSPGGLKFYDGPAKPREVMAAARANGVGVMGIRAVQAGALTAAIDRAVAGGSSGGAGLCPGRRIPRAVRGNRRGPGDPRASLRAGACRSTRWCWASRTGRNWRAASPRPKRGRCRRIWSRGSMHRRRRG